MKLRLAVLAGALVMSAGMANAATCAAGNIIFDIDNITNATQYASGFSCEGGPGDGLTFSNFQLITHFGFSGSTDFSLGLTAGTNAATGLLAFGNTLLTGSQDFQLIFQVSGASVSEVGLALGSGGISEHLCDSAGVGVSGSCLGSNPGDPVSILVSGGGSASITLLSSNNDFWVIKDVGVGTSEFSQTFTSSDVPEPMTFSMVGLGLLGLGLVARRRAAKR